MKAKEVAIYAGLALAGFAAYRLLVTAQKVAKAGANAGTAVSAAVTQLVTKDLNPASDENIIYRGANATLQSISGNSTDTIGTAFYGWWSKISSANAYTTFGSPADTSQQVFREAEIIQQNKDAKALQAADVKMSNAKSEFRLLELQDQKVSNGEISTGVAFGIYPSAF